MTPPLRSRAAAVAAVFLLFTPSAALRAQEPADATDRADPRSSLVAIRALQHFDRWEEAVTNADAALRAHPDDPDLLGLAALVYRRAGRIDRAEEAAKRARNADPARKSYWALIAAGEAADWRSDRAAAREAYERAVALRRDGAEGWFGLIWATPAGDPREKEAAQRYLALAPTGYPHDRQLKDVREWLDSLSWRRRHFPGGVKLLAPKAEGAVTSIPFTFEKGVPVIRASINGVPVRLLWDTGAAGMTLTPKAAARTGARTVGRATFRGIHGEEAAPVARVDSIQFGTIKLGPVRAAVIGDKGDFVDGNVGGEVFEDLVVTADFAKKRIALRHKEAVDAKRFPEAQAGETAVTLPFYNRGGWILLPVNAGGEGGVAVVDSGTNLDSLSERWLRRLSAGLPADDVKTHTLKQRVGFGKETAEHRVSFLVREFDLNLSFSGDSGLSLRYPVGMGSPDIDRFVSAPSGFEVGALLGTSFLTAFRRVTIDYPARSLTLVTAEKRDVVPLAEAGPLMPSVRRGDSPAQTASAAAPAAAGFTVTIGGMTVGGTTGVSPPSGTLQVPAKLSSERHRWIHAAGVWIEVPSGEKVGLPGPVAIDPSPPFTSPVGYVVYTSSKGHLVAPAGSTLSEDGKTLTVW